MSRVIPCLSLLLLLACGEPSQPAAPAAKVSAYPRTAEEVVNDSRFAMTYQGKRTGIEYYVRTISTDEVSQMPDDYVIEGDEDDNWVYVPIKDGKIVKAQLEDIMGLGYAMNQ